MESLNYYQENLSRFSNPPRPDNDSKNRSGESPATNAIPSALNSETLPSDIMSHHQQIQCLENPRDLTLSDNELLGVTLNNYPTTNNQQHLSASNNSQYAFQHFDNQDNQTSLSIRENQDIEIEDQDMNLLGIDSTMFSADFLDNMLPDSFLDTPGTILNASNFLQNDPVSASLNNDLDAEMYIESARSFSCSSSEPSGNQPPISNYIDSLQSSHKPSISNSLIVPDSLQFPLESSPTNLPAVNDSQSQTTNISPDSAQKSSSPSIKSHISSSSYTSLSSSESLGTKKEKGKSASSRFPSMNDADFTPPSYMPDFSPNSWNDVSNLKYGMIVSGAPPKSRVETQIKIAIDFYPPPAEFLVHLPTDTISKPKLQLKEPFTPITTVLSLDTIVVCVTDNSRYVNMCRCCLNRERKRAFRKKVRLPAEDAHWDLDQEKRSIVFNCKEVVDFGPLVDIEVDGQQVKAKRIELPIRMACYCRHHNEKVGFKALFVVRNYTGEVVARGSTTSIMITDDHKAAPAKANAGVKRPNPEIETPVDSLNMVNTAPSRKVIEPEFTVPRKKKLFESKASIAPLTTSSSSALAASLAPKTQNSYPSKRSHTRKSVSGKSRTSKSSVPSPSSNVPSNASSPSYQFNIKSPFSPPASLTYSPPTSLDFNSIRANGNSITRPQSTQSPTLSSPPVSNQLINHFNSISNTVTSILPTNDTMARYSSFQGRNVDIPLPTIEKIIPQVGPVRGGIEVSLFGANFVNGLIAKFGEARAISTTRWSPESLITQLPPSKCPGPVIVSFEGISSPISKIFSYYDDSDVQLMELALRVLGDKMNGALQDARDIARRIVGSGTGHDSDINSFANSFADSSPNTNNHAAEGNGSDNPPSGIPLERLENVLLSLVDFMNSYKNGLSPNWQLRNTEGQVMLHLASILGFDAFCSVLLSNGAHVDIQDCNGYTPLHFAALHGHNSIISQLLEHNADPSIRTYYGQTYNNLLADENSSVSPTDSLSQRSETNASGSLQTGTNDAIRHPTTQEMFVFKGTETGEDSSDEDDGEENNFSDDEFDDPVSSFQFTFNDDEFEDSSPESDSDYFEESSELEDEFEDDNRKLMLTLEKQELPRNGDKENETNADLQPTTFVDRLGSLIPLFLRGSTPMSEPEEANSQTETVNNFFIPSNMNGLFDVRQWYGNNSDRTDNQSIQKNPFATGSAMFRSLFERNGATTPSSANKGGVGPSSRFSSTDDDFPNSAPPDYYDLFPEGNGKQGLNYSSATIEEEKRHEEQKVKEVLSESVTTGVIEVSGTHTDTEQVSVQEDSVEFINTHKKSDSEFSSTSITSNTKPSKAGSIPTDEEEVEIWRNNRKKLQNDRMFLFFWLPVFIFVLVWVCYNAISYMDRFDATESLRVHAERLVKNVAASVLGVEKYQRYQQRAIDAIKAIDRATTAAVTGVANAAGVATTTNFRNLVENEN